MKKTPPGIHTRKKCAKFQPNRTIKSPACPKVFGQTCIQTLSDSSSTEVEKSYGKAKFIRSTKVKALDIPPGKLTPDEGPPTSNDELVFNPSVRTSSNRVRRVRLS